MYIKRSRFAHIALAPNLSEQLLALDRNTCTCDQHFEKLEFLQGKPQVVTFVKDLVYVIVNDKALLTCHVEIGTANVGLDTGDQLKHGKWLGHIIVSPLVQSLDSTDLVGLCTHDNDGDLLIHFSDLCEDGVSVHIGKHDIKNNEARASFRKLTKEVLAVFKHFRSKNTFKSAFVKLAYAFVVFNYINDLIH